MKKIALILIFAVLLTGCMGSGTTPSPTPDDNSLNSEERQAVAKIFETWEKSFRSNNKQEEFSSLFGSQVYVKEIFPNEPTKETTLAKSDMQGYYDTLPQGATFSLVERIEKKLSNNKIELLATAKIANEVYYDLQFVLTLNQGWTISELTISFSADPSSDEEPQDPGEEDPGEEDPGEEDPGEEDPGEEDPGEEDPGEEDPEEQHIIWELPFKLESMQSRLFLKDIPGYDASIHQFTDADFYGYIGDDWDSWGEEVYVEVIFIGNVGYNYEDPHPIYYPEWMEYDWDPPHSQDGKVWYDPNIDELWYMHGALGTRFYKLVRYNQPVERRNYTP